MKFLFYGKGDTASGDDETQKRQASSSRMIGKGRIDPTDVGLYRGPS